jgi:hypothetical protein
MKVTSIAAISPSASHCIGRYFAILALLFLPCSLVHGQNGTGGSRTFKFECGMSVVTCYSGATKGAAFTDQCNTSVPADPNGFVVAILDARNTNTAPLGSNWTAVSSSGFHNSGGATPFNQQWRATNMGEVFGIALDDSSPANIYVASTSIYPNETSTPNGTIYRLDGSTFTPTVFAALSGVGSVSLGNICFDKGNRQFFVADLDHGWIRRLNMSGVEQVPPFDHGAQPAINILDTSGPDALTDSGRRVFGLQVFQNRLYYSVWSTVANEIWSVGLDPSGNFITVGPNGPRVEITAPTYPALLHPDLPVTDIAFSQAGNMLIAERAICTLNSSNLNTGPAHFSRVMEFTGSTTNWAFLKKHAVGGGSGNNSEGGIDFTCDGLIYAMGDGLFVQFPPNPPPILVYGLQIITPASTGPSTSYLIDLDNDTTGYDKNFLGDVEVYRCCDCITFNSDKLECTGPNTFTWFFCFTNTGTLTNGHLVFLDLLPGMTINPPVVDLNPPLAPGQGICTNITVTFNPKNAPNNLCFRIAAHTPDFQECCIVPKCLPIPDCCGIISKENIKCDPAGGSVIWSFNYANLSGVPISYLYIIPDPASCASVSPNVITFNPPLSNGATTNLSIPITVTNSPCDKVCFLLSTHDSDMKDCCAFQHCVSLRCDHGNTPPEIACGGATVICDLNQGKNITNTVVVMDAEGDPLTVIWNVDGIPVQTNNIPAGVAAAPYPVQLVWNYGPGSHVITVSVTDGHGTPMICESTLAVGDQTPPKITCPPDRTIDAWQYVVPNATGQVKVSDDCTPASQIKITQQPPPGTVFTNAINCIQFTATDLAGNTATCTTCIRLTPLHLSVSGVPTGIFGQATGIEPANATLTVNGALSEISSVQYFANDQLIGVGTGPDFRFAWQKIAYGSYSVVARGTKSGSPQVSISSPVLLYVMPRSEPGAVPSFASIKLEDGNLVVSMLTVAGERCAIEMSTNLSSGPWKALEQTVGDGTVQTFRLQTTDTEKFLRLRVDR